jgi:hypothetical protein
MGLILKGMSTSSAHPPTDGADPEGEMRPGLRTRTLPDEYGEPETLPRPQRGMRLPVYGGDCRPTLGRRMIQ